MAASRPQTSSTAGGTTYLGITEPINIDPPKLQDSKFNAELEKTLREFNLFESVEESRKREEVLGKLYVIVKDWARQVSIKKGLPDHIASETGAKIFTFGSYRLGVHISGADIDTLCIGPQHIDRSDFFSSLSEILRQQKEVTEVTCVPDAYVPVMRIEFSGISIDLLFARLNLSTIPDDLDILDSNILKNVDEKSILSLNGCRVTDQILKLVPNIANFRMTLRCMKFWAQRRGIYSNVVGFLGGVSWGILTARICQLYPNALPSTLVSKFFQFYCKWNWPNPILLTHLHDAKLGHPIWNPNLNPKDRLHLMPIITPAYPSMNSTYNVSASTLKLMKEELIRGAEVTIKIEKNVSPWSTLFDKCDFFSRYKVYLQVDILAQTELEHRKWEGLVESRLRVLIQKLEYTQYVLHAHPYPKVFNNPQSQTNGFSFCSSFFMGLTFNLPANKEGGNSVDLTPAVGEFTTRVREWTDRTAGMDVRVHYLRKQKLPQVVLDAFPPPAPSAEPVSLKRELPIGGTSQAKRPRPDSASPAQSTQPSPSSPPSALSHLSLDKGTPTSPPLAADGQTSPPPPTLPSPLSSPAPSTAKPAPSTPSTPATPPAKPAASTTPNKTPAASPSSTPTLPPPATAPTPATSTSPTPIPTFTPPLTAASPTPTPTPISLATSPTPAQPLATTQQPLAPPPSTSSNNTAPATASTTPTPTDPLPSPPSKPIGSDLDELIPEHDLGELEVVGQNGTEKKPPMRSLSANKKGFLSVNLLRS